MKPVVNYKTNDREDSLFGGLVKKIVVDGNTADILTEMLNSEDVTIVYNSVEKFYKELNSPDLTTERKEELENYLNLYTPVKEALDLFFFSDCLVIDLRFSDESGDIQNNIHILSRRKDNGSGIEVKFISFGEQYTWILEFTNDNYAD